MHIETCDSIRAGHKYFVQAAREVLQAIPYKANEVVVHSDETLMPKRRDTWASWNFLGRTDSDEEGAVCVSYWANRLQSLPERAPDTFVTLNPIVEPEEKKIYRRLSLAHPVFSFDSYRAQQRLPGIQVWQLLMDSAHVTCSCS